MVYFSHLTPFLLFLYQLGSQGVLFDVVDKSVKFKVWDEVDANGNLTSPISSLLKNEVVEQTLEKCIVSAEKKKCTQNIYLEATANSTLTNDVTNATGALLSNRDIVRNNLKQQTISSEMRATEVMQSLTASRNINRINSEDTGIHSLTGWPTFPIDENDPNVFMFGEGFTVKQAPYPEGRRDYKDLIIQNQALATAVMGLMRSMIINDQQVKPHELSADIYKNTISDWKRFLEVLITDVYLEIYGAEDIKLAFITDRISKSMDRSNTSTKIKSKTGGDVGVGMKPDKKLPKSRVNGRKSIEYYERGKMKKIDDIDDNFQDYALNIEFCNSMTTNSLVGMLDDGFIDFSLFSKYVGAKNHIPMSKLPQTRLHTSEERKMILKTELEERLIKLKATIDKDILKLKTEMNASAKVSGSEPKVAAKRVSNVNDTRKRGMESNGKTTKNAPNDVLDTLTLRAHESNKRKRVGESAKVSSQKRHKNRIN